MSARREVRGPAPMEESLERDCNHYQFFQAVLLLERLRESGRPLGGFGGPSDEVVHIGVNPSLAFPPSEIQALELPDKGPARMTVNFMGLVGPLGVLPHAYTTLVAERIRAKDTSLRDFLDLFHHRMISLFYRAWRKHRFTVDVEEGLTDRVSEHVMDLGGMGLEGFRARSPVPDEVMVEYGALLMPVQRGGLALEELLKDHFGVPAHVEQFVGGWYPLTGKDRCALGDDDSASSQLGLGAAAGNEVWDQQARVRIRLGPLEKEAFDRFLPGGRDHDALRDITRFFSHDQFDFEVQLVLESDQVPACVLGGSAETDQPLGWGTWVRSAPRARDADETVFSL